MDFRHTAEQEAVRAAVERICAGFDDAYWTERDRDGRFPTELHQALARDGWLGICMPEAYGGAGLGITEAAIMMQAISESGAGMTGASAVHMNIFGLNPVVVFGTEAQKRRMLPPLIAGQERACFAVTEPNTGLDTTQLRTRAERRGDRYVIHGQKVWISTAQVAEKILILARTTPIEGGVEQASAPKGSACSTPPSTAAASRCARSRRWAARPWTPTSSSSTGSKCRWRTASVRRARALTTFCTG